MSHDRTVDFKRKMGENCHTKVLQWKAEIEKQKLALLPLKEVQTKQDLAEVEFKEQSWGNTNTMHLKCFSIAKTS